VVDAVVKKGAGGQGKVILVTINAGMLDLASAKANTGVHAIINLAYLGESSGDALAATILGDSVPSGRLPITYYANISAALGQRLGNSYSMHPDSNGIGGKTYRYFDGEERRVCVCVCVCVCL
jgi:beta-glucosidase